MSNVFLLLGSNLGNRMANLANATTAIVNNIGILLNSSKIYETAAWGKEHFPPHLNQVLHIETSLSPQELLQHTQAIEIELGRVKLEKWGTRTIDIDILFYDELIYFSDKLTIPHPQIQHRLFTLIPLAEIAGEYIHPSLHQSIQVLLDDCKDTLPVNLYVPTPNQQ